MFMKWIYILCSCLGRLNTVKMSVLSDIIYRFNAIPIKIPVSYFEDINKLILKFIWRGKRPRIANSFLREKNNWRTDIIFHPYYNTTVIKTVWYWWNIRQIDQWNRIVSPETDPHKQIKSTDLWQSSKGNTMEKKLLEQQNFLMHRLHTFHKN